MTGATQRACVLHRCAEQSRRAIGAAPETRQRGHGECCALCGWKLANHHDDVRVQCGRIERSGQLDVLTSRVESWKDAGDWCVHFDRYTARGE